MINIAGYLAFALIWNITWFSGNNSTLVEIERELCDIIVHCFKVLFWAVNFDNLSLIIISYFQYKDQIAEVAKSGFAVFLRMIYL